MFEVYVKNLMEWRRRRRNTARVWGSDEASSLNSSVDVRHYSAGYAAVWLLELFLPTVPISGIMGLQMDFYPSSPSPPHL